MSNEKELQPHSRVYNYKENNIVNSNRNVEALTMKGELRFVSWSARVKEKILEQLKKALMVIKCHWAIL